MFNLKKYFTDELLQVALILSLLRIDRRSLEYNVPAIGISTNNLTSTWDQSNILVRREGRIHPKSIDSLLLNYEQEVFEELNSLGRYSTIFDTLTPRNLAAYLLSVDDPQSVVDTVEEAASSVSSSASTDTTEDLETLHKKDIDSGQLSQEDLDLIEILWKYDVNVESSEFLEEVSEIRSLRGGVAPPDEPFAPDGSSSITAEVTNPSENALPGNATAISDSEQLQNENVEDDAEEELAEKVFHDDLLDSDPWLGVSSVTSISDQEQFDNEERFNLNDATVIKDEVDDDDDVFSPAIFGPEFSLEETLQLTDLNEVDRFPVDFWQLLSIKTEANSEDVEEEKTKEEEEIKEDPGIEADFLDDEELELDLLSNFANMIHAPAPQYHHSRPFPSRSIPPYVRTMGMDHRWQDFANVMNFPDTNHATPYHHHHYHPAAAATSSYSPAMASTYPSHHVQIPSSADNVNARNSLLHNSTLPGSISDPNNTPYSSLNNSCSVGTTVANSMNLANNSVAETVISSDNTTPAFKIESSHQETVYPYQNSCTEMNHTTEGFLSSILNDDDLQMMDMAMNEGMYSMRMLDNGCNVTQNCVERGTDSDSAVSSMGSERVPSLSSDTEWMETNSDSGHTPADHYPSDYCNKYRWYDNFMYGSRAPATGEGSPNSTSSRLSQIPQKKYQLYGRRSFQEQNTNHHIVHNHTYHVPPEAINGATGTIQKPIFRDKMRSKSGRRSEDEQLTRDEKRARNLNIPITVFDVINLPMDEFNERLSKYDLSETQLSLIRDIRRRGKNKVAAQNCRKRKLDQITSLEEEVKHMKDRKHKLLHDREFFSMEKQKVHSKYVQLFRHIFSRLRENEQQEFRLYEASMPQKKPASNGTILPLDMDQSSEYNPRTKNKDRKL